MLCCEGDVNFVEDENSVNGVFCETRVVPLFLSEDTNHYTTICKWHHQSQIIEDTIEPSCLSGN